jgi:2-aminoadipate transaminase
LEKQPFVRLSLNSEHAGRKLNVEQLVKMIREQILSDSHLKGCRLPPVRALAHQLGISKNTVQTAYEELKAQGLVESRDRTGLYVAQDTEAVPVAIPSHVPGVELKKIGVHRYVKPKQNGIIHLSSVFVDPDLLPKEKLSACLRSVLKSPGMPEFHDPQGMPQLREKIALRLRDRGMDVDSDHVIITNGSQQGLDIVTRALATRVVATEDPAYSLGKILFEMNGINTVGLPIDPFSGVDTEVWQRKLAETKPGLVYLTTNFQNPNGYSYSSRELSNIVHWAREFGFGILEDDWGSEMLSYSEFKPGLRTLGGANVLYMNSFTKKLLPSMRIGYLVANSQTIDVLLMSKRVSTLGIPSIIEATLFEFLDRGYYDTHLRSIQEELDIRYEHCLSCLREHMPESVKWTSPGGGPVLWLEIPKRVDLNEMCGRLKEQGILIQLSNDAYFAEPRSHGFKIGYAFLNQSQMEEAIDKTAREIKRQINV